MSDKQPRESCALIVGGSGAIGRAVRIAAETRGIKVISTARTEGTDCRKLDVLDDRSIDLLAEAVPALDYVVFAHGIQPSKSLRQSSRAHILGMLETHVVGTMICLKQLLPKLNPGSSVVLVSSVAVQKGSYDPAYAAAKGALGALVRSLAVELRDVSRVNAIAPGLVADSPVHQSMTVAHAQRHADRMFHHRLVTADCVAELVMQLWLNPFINAAIVPIDGGYLA